MTTFMPDSVAERMMEKAGSDRLNAFYLAIDAVRRGGTISLIGVYGGMADPLPMLTLFDKQIKLTMGQANVKRWVEDIMPLLTDGDPLGIEVFHTHQLPLEEAPRGYEIFQKKQDGAIKILPKPRPNSPRQVDRRPDLHLLNMKIREFRESDHRQVVSVVDGWGGRRMVDKLPQLFYRYIRQTSFVVEEDGAMIAFLVGFVGDAEEAYIHFVGVHPEHRNRGTGRRLYAAFFEEARQRGCRRVRCITSPVNEDSIAFHKRLGLRIVEGYREVGGVSVHPDYDGDGKDKVVFEKMC